MKKIPKRPAKDREYTVERIVAKRGSGKKLQYQVKRTGWPTSANLWLPAVGLKNAPDRIAQFEERAARHQKGGAQTLELRVWPIELLPKHAGTRVLIGLRPNRRASYTVYQNLRVRIGAASYDYLEAWSMGSAKKQWDFFSVPAELCEDTYTSTADMWIEPGGIDSSYQPGVLYDADSPWGLARGRWDMREPPEGAAVTTRTTTLRWQDGEMLPPQETRQVYTYVG